MKKVETSFIKSVKRVIASRTRSSQESQQLQKSLTVKTPKILPKSKSSTASFHQTNNGKANKSPETELKRVLLEEQNNQEGLKTKLSTMRNIVVNVEEEDQANLAKEYQEELAKLKVEKLELLRQNVAIQRELKRSVIIWSFYEL